MYCLGCSYELRGLEGRVCPECGRGFDPGDRATFRPHERQLGVERCLEGALIGVSASMLLANVGVHVMLIAARVSLGRWPHRGGADDPKGIAGIGVLYVLIAILLNAAIFAVFPAVTLAIALAVHRAWGRLKRSVLLGLVLWLSGFALWWWDPAQAWYWYHD